MKPYVVEEAYEVCQAIDGGNNASLMDELGDLLLQVVFHAELAAERGAFTIDDVVDGLVAKLVRRHPHVFGDVAVSSSAEVLTNWSRIKAREREEKEGGAAPGGALSGVPRALPSLLRAHRLGERAAAVGFDWPDPAAARAKVDEEVAELDDAVAAEDPGGTAAELGDVLFAASNYARLLRVNAEMALQATLDRFERRFRAVEADLAARGADMRTATPSEVDRAWQRAKVSTSIKEPGAST